MVLSREDAVVLDAADPLSPIRDLFEIAAGDLVYLDGNSLGRLPRATPGRLDDFVRREWGAELVRGWSSWMELPTTVGDLIGEHLLGAAPGQVVVSDSTTVNLFKLASAAAAARPGRRVLVTDDDNFPTDRYVLEGLAASAGLELRILHADIDEGLSTEELTAGVDDDTALVVLSHVAYRSGALLDMKAVTSLVQDRGALLLWDLCHAAGAVPIDLDGSGVDLAVGCGYKYLNGGPGAPSFLYVRRDLQPELVSPIWGWFAQRDQFAMGPTFQPHPDVRRFLAGTIPVAGLVALEEGVRPLAQAGIAALRAKGAALTSLIIELHDAWLAELGFRLATPRAADRRGSHVSLEHPDAWRICRALIERRGVIPDFRGPDRLRLGPAPAYTRFVDVWDALDRIRQVVLTREFEEVSDELPAVT
jgi:kynureninase